MNKTDNNVPAFVTDRMSREQAAEYIGVEVQTLAAWACAGRYGIPYTRVGRKCFYKRSDLDKWLDSRTHTSTAAFAAALA
jgi:excisionase family DNA binding protein